MLTASVSAVLSERTRTTQLTVYPPSSVVAVMRVSPGPTAVTTPPLTVATAALEDAQITFLFLATEGPTVALRVNVLPSNISASVRSIEISYTLPWNSAVSFEKKSISPFVPTPLPLIRPRLIVSRVLSANFASSIRYSFPLL